jgi:hypothetical protein
MIMKLKKSEARAQGTVEAMNKIDGKRKRL